MEKLPPISTNLIILDEMYTSMLEHKDYDVIRKYESTKLNSDAKKSPTKKGSFLDDSIKMNSSPGPASKNIHIKDKSNLQQIWAVPNKQIVKYADRKTYVDEIAIKAKRKSSPSPNQYNVKMPWPDKATKAGHICEKTNFLDNFEYESNKTPGPGNYMIATQIAKKVKEFHYTENKPLQPRKEISANMNTYDPVPQDYSTFKKYEKTGKVKTTIKKEEPKKERENLSPGPGQYQMINTWQGKEQKMEKGSLSYMNKITKGPSHSIYN